MIYPGGATPPPPPPPPPEKQSKAAVTMGKRGASLLGGREGRSFFEGEKNKNITWAEKKWKGWGEKEMEGQEKEKSVEGCAVL